MSTMNNIINTLNKREVYFPIIFLSLVLVSVAGWNFAKLSGRADRDAFIKRQIIGLHDWPNGQRALVYQRDIVTAAENASIDLQIDRAMGMDVSRADIRIARRDVNKAQENFRKWKSEKVINNPDMRREFYRRTRRVR